MIKLTAYDLIKHCDCKLLIGNENEEIKECFVDSRKITEDGCFFGIKGERQDGSLFYKQAFDNGAKICVISKILDLDLKCYEDKIVLVSSDVKKTLQSLAAYKRSLFNGDVIAVTGSVGKTSTKQILSNILSNKYKVLKTLGNQNSQIGLPLTILRLKDEDVMVLEMGMSNIGEIHNLSIIAKPNIAVITNVYDSHIGNLGSKENILKAKLEIIDGMEDGTLIINNDNDMLKTIKQNVKKGINVMTFGILNKSNVMPSNIKEGVKTSFDIEDVSGFLINASSSFIYNALASYLVSKLLGVSRGMIKEGVNKSVNEKHRLEVISLDNNITLIDDSYNASYDSVKLALEYMKNFKGNKIVVLADILELGKESKNIHRKIGNLVANNNVDYLITIGKYSKYIGKQAKILKMKKKFIKHFKSEEKSRKFIRKVLKENDIILIKGSNGMKLINLVEYLK